MNQTDESIIEARRAQAAAEGPDVTTHILHFGLPLCGIFPGKVPGEWPPGHKWFGLTAGRKPTCFDCALGQRRYTEGQARAWKLFGDGYEAGVTAMLFSNGRIWVCDRGSEGILDAWCYDSIGEALQAFIEWTDPEVEPEGWIRHPRTGRRRPGGDKAREYVNP